MSTNLELEATMEKKNFAPKGCLMQVDASRLGRQDASGPGGNQLPSAPFKSKAQSRSRRALQGASSSASLRSEPGSRKYPSKGSRKGKNGDDLEQMSEKDGSPAGPAEFGSLQLPGSKKQNLNHLLNFHFTPRESHGRGLGVGNVQRVPRAVRTKQQSDSFIQANCQFVVSSDEDVEYHVDLPFNWTSVEQMIIRTYGGSPGCPICLAVPSAGKITKCGHIFCWSCILRYFSYGDGNFQPCPICFKSICPQELKSVVANVLDEFHVGDLVKVELMCRKKNCSTSPAPVSSKLGGNMENNDWEKRFQKLIRLTPTQVQTEVLEREHVELRRQLEGTIESLETEFVMAAISELDKRMELLLEKINRGQGYGAVGPAEAKPADCDGDGANGTTDNSKIKDVKRVRVKRRGKSADKIPRVGAGLNLSINWDEYSCFYQAADGSNTFMSPLNMAMFWKCFGQNLSDWPQTIPLRVIEIELLTVTVDLRKRLRFLQHLPLNSSIQLMEFELKGIVSTDVISEFNYQLSERERRRSERVRMEKRRDRLQQQEAERMSHLEPAKPRIGSLQDFPECGSPEAEAQALEYAIQASLAETEHGIGGGRDGKACTAPIPVSHRPPSSESASFPILGEMSTSPSLSFAQALNAPSVWKRSPTFPVTMKPGNQSTSSLSAIRQRGVSESELDQDGSNVPEFRASVSDAIASAFANFELNETTGEENGPSASGGLAGQKKKGRKKGKVLFATAMVMGSK